MMCPRIIAGIEMPISRRLLLSSARRDSLRRDNPCLSTSKVSLEVPEQQINIPRIYLNKTKFICSIPERRGAGSQFEVSRYICMYVGT